MTTEVEIKNVNGPKNIKVSVTHFTDVENPNTVEFLRCGFTILQPGESTKLPVFDIQQIVVSEVP